jgi:hypothetical protein
MRQCQLDQMQRAEAIQFHRLAPLIEVGGLEQAAGHAKCTNA